MRTLLFHPWRVGTLLATRANVVYVAQLLAPVGFLALGAPLYLLAAAPILAQHMLSLRPTEQTILYHYTAPLLPSIMVATVFALRRVGFASLRRVPRVLVASAVLGAAGVTGVWWGAPARMKQPESASRFTAPDAADRAKQELVDDVPPNAPVVASFEFLARLANRAALYSFHNVVIGKKIISNQDYELPPAVSWALIDFADPTIFAGSFYWGRPGGDARTRRMLTTGTWRTAAEAGSVVLFQRVDDASREAGAASAAPTRRVVLEQVPELRGWTVSALRARAGARVPIDWYWQLPMGTADGYWVYVAIVQDGRMLHREQRLACANVPLSTSQVVQERMTLLLPDDLAPGTYAIDGFVVRHETGRGAPAGKQLARLPLGSLEIVR